VGGQTITLDRRIVRGLQRQDANAVMLSEIQSGGPGARAGLQSGDVLLDFDGHTLASLDQLHRLLTAERAHRDIPVRVLRRGKLLELLICPEAA
jgi:serine protease Do